MTALIALVVAVAALIVGARIGYAAGQRDARKCALCAARAAEAQETAALNDLYNAPAYGDD